ncbi:sensitivity to high expression protein she9 [Purpureocillium lilacinum]|uniref:sensitivity to high expression protein she9 n=1 Tax=Purpureocillium lilacinum TaxID=33203 RepID=UPI00208ABA61|nr:sensitivity to high expression protein she9 [Purpureocillium lilacinum]
MQPFGRPVAQAAWAHGRRLLLTDRAAFRPSVAATADAFQPNKSLYLPCAARGAIASRLRLYSTQKPPNDTDKARSMDPDLDAPTPDPLPHSPELPSSRDRRRSDLNQQFSHLMDNLQSRVLTASHTLNDITGYSSIEGIKAENEALEVQLADAQSRVRSARQAYKTSNTKRATTQREVTTLLARKDSWSPHDLERFTELYRADHVLEGEVASAQESLTEAEADEQKLSQRLNAGILKRYHEEQIWSDRIRRASTWGTWGLMGMNFVLFVVLQFVAEPWRRRRLVKGVVAEEKAVLEEVRNELEAVKLGLAKKDEEQVRQREQELAVEQSATLAAEQEVSDAQGMGPEGTWREILLDPGRWQTAVQDLGSERRIGLRMRDASVLVLEAALAGAAIAGSIALLLARGA